METMGIMGLLLFVQSVNLLWSVISKMKSSIIVFNIFGVMVLEALFFIVVNG